MEDKEKHLRVKLSDYAGACEDVGELIDSIMALTDKKTSAFALLDMLVKRAKDAGGLWVEIQKLGFTGTANQAAYFLFAEELLQAQEKGEITAKKTSA